MPKGTWQGGGTWQTTGGGGGLVVVLIVAAVLIGSGAVTAIVHALEVVLIVTGCIIGAAVLGVAAWLIVRARSDRPGAPITARVISQAPPGPRPQLEESRKPAAIGPGREVHYHFHVSAAELAAIMQHYPEGKADES